MREREVIRELALMALARIDGEDIERAHNVADRVLCDLLYALGYQDVVSAYEKVPKWYS